MSTITATIWTIILFMIKAIAYGLGLAFGFWVMGKCTGYAEYYVSLFKYDRDRFWSEIRSNPL